MDVSVVPSSPVECAWSAAPVRAVSLVCCSSAECSQIPCTFCAQVDRAAAQEGTTVSAWLADTAAHRLRLDAGRRGLAEWERKNGALTADELAEGLARARAVLRRSTPSRKSA